METSLRAEWEPMSCLLHITRGTPTRSPDHQGNNHQITRSPEEQSPDHQVTSTTSSPPDQFHQTSCLVKKNRSLYSLPASGNDQTDRFLLKRPYNLPTLLTGKSKTVGVQSWQAVLCWWARAIRCGVTASPQLRIRNASDRNSARWFPGSSSSGRGGCPEPSVSRRGR